MPDCLPILYSFRRCPYAIRARLSLHYAGISVEHREVILRDKPTHLLDISPKGTVPVLQLTDGTVLEESLDIMHWALQQSDPKQWWPSDVTQQHKTNDLIAHNDTRFKAALDRYKYPNRYQDTAPEVHRDVAFSWLKVLETQLTQHRCLVTDRMTLADYALLPFIRQFSKVEPEWFADLKVPHLHQWLDDFLSSELFTAVMAKQA